MADFAPIWIAVIVAVPTVLATTLVPLLMQRSTTKARREERKEDWKRQDDVAEKAASTARSLIERQSQVAEKAAVAVDLLAENTAIQVAATKTLTEKVDVVHTLVNSNLTLATQKTREAKQGKLTLLLKHEPESTEIDLLKLEVAELDAVLKDRLTQQKAVETQQAQQGR